MDKRTKARWEQGYNPKPVQRICQTCANFEFDRVPTHEFFGKQYFSDKNLRCGIGGFAVKKMGHCNLHELKTAQSDRCPCHDKGEGE